MNSTSTPVGRALPSYQGLPPLVGLGNFDAAMLPGLSVEESVRRLKRHHYVLRRLHQIFIARITSEPVYELKMAFSYHAYLCSEQVTELRQRVGEMREPPLGLDKVPHAALELFFNEILSAPTTAALLLGLYEATLPALLGALEKHQSETHLLADQPTRRLCNRAVVDVQEMLSYGQAAIRCLAPPEQRESTAGWLELLRDCLAAAGGMDGTAPEAGTLPSRMHSARPYAFDGVPRRDERFPDPYNMGVNAEVFLYDEQQPAEAKVLMMFYKRLREIDVPEMMASIIAETPDKPWNYYRDMTRQLWDEARHAMMGEVGFLSVGIDWPRQVMVNFTWSLGLNTQLTPKERHAVLYFIEQGLMPKTGKRHEWEVSVTAKNPLAATFQDFDWADEVLHARVGRDWYVSDMPSPREAVDYGDACWSKVLMNWEVWRQKGLTRHRNWWPDAYTRYCAARGLQPDPKVLSYDVSYEATRADLKALTGSA
jgi:hypothetical protein